MQTPGNGSANRSKEQAHRRTASPGGSRAHGRTRPGHDQDTTNNHQIYDRPGNDPDAGAGANDLQKQFDAPSIKDSERNAGGDQSTQADKSESDKLGQGYSPDKDRAKELNKKHGWTKGPFKTTRRRMAALSVAMGLFLGGGLGVFSIIQKPLEQWQLAETLDNFSERNDRSIQSRIGKLYGSSLGRLARSGEVGETRVGRFGSIHVAELRQRMSDIGVEFETSSRTGRPITIFIDPSKNPNLQNARSDQAKRQAIARYFDIDPSEVNVADLQRYSIDVGGRSIGAARALLFTPLADLSDGRIAGALHKRVFGKFFGLPSLFSPFSRFEAEVNRRAADFASRQSRKAIEAARRNGLLPEPTGNVQRKITAARAEFNSRVSPGAIKAVGSALDVTDAMCLLSGMRRSIPFVNYGNVVAPSLVAATDRQAIGGGIKTGVAPLLVLGAMSESLVDEDGQTVWGGKALDALLKGGLGTGIDIDSGLGAASRSLRRVRRPLADSEAPSTATGSGGSSTCQR